MKKPKQKHDPETENLSAQRALDKILGYAVDQEVESIMFDFSDEQRSVYYKFFNDWKKMIDMPQKIRKDLSELIKSSASLLPAEKFPASGKFKRDYGYFKVVFCVSVNPLNKGEKIFIDIFKDNSKLFGLRQLGMQDFTLRRVERILRRHSRMSVVLGNFNSGRTTTLYSLLDYLNNPDLNVCTIEQKIDIDVPYVNQCQINKAWGFDYPSAINTFFRQDPDVIMVGDIADKETAEKAFEASARGHAVLVGLYSKDTAFAMQFLRDLGVPLHLFLEAVNMFLNQRVVNKTCHHCLVKEKKGSAKIKELKKNFDWKYLLPKLKDLKAIPKEIRSIEDLPFYKSKGCKNCDNTGFNGQIGVYEILEIDSEIRDIAKKGHLPVIRESIRSQGGLYIKEDALIKALNGITTIDEVIRVASE